MITNLLIILDIQDEIQRTILFKKYSRNKQIHYTYTYIYLIYQMRFFSCAVHFHLLDSDYFIITNVYQIFKI